MVWQDNCIRQFVTILSLNKTRDIKTEGFCTSPLCRKNRFSVWARSACFFYFTGKIVLLENDVGLPALFLHPELINNEIHCAHF
ncbi:hypothetical protein D7X48_13260 [bacterium D16-50]|nr:hypothetical protein D7X48_13260 [bacterium D16-50]